MENSGQKPWKPRGSALGGYFACDMRAKYDRMVYDGELESPGCESSAYADFGTLCHYELMANQLRLKFPDGKEAPTPEMEANAMGLFNGNAERMHARKLSVAMRAAAHFPVAPEGTEWLAETAYKQPWLQGHIDFISSDGSEIGDLKTTSRKPDKGRIKPEHYYQLMGYVLLAEAVGADVRRGWILYEGSISDFSLRVDVDLSTPQAHAMRAHVRKQIQYLRGARLATWAMPRLGSHCSSGFCPHRVRCHDTIVPEIGTDLGAVAPVASIPANPFGALS